MSRNALTAEERHQMVAGAAFMGGMVLMLVGEGLVLFTVLGLVPAIIGAFLFGWGLGHGTW